MGDHSDVQIEQIKAVNHHLRLAVDQIGEGVVIVEPGPLTDQGPDVVFANEAILKLTGLAKKELVGHRLSQIYPGEEFGDLLRRLATSLTAGTAVPPFESGIRLADGSTIPCKWTARPVRDPAGTPLTIILTAAFAKESAHIAAPTRGALNTPSEFSEEPIPGTGRQDAPPSTDEYLERNRLESLAMLAGGIAHDFRNSLTAIIANLSLAKPLAQPGTELEQHLEDVEVAAEGAKELTSHLLAFARGSKPKRELSDISRLVKESIQLATYGASVKCRVTMDDDLWQSEIDRTQIKQVLNNLIINAWQAMPGGGTIRITAENTQVTDGMNVDLRPGQYVALAVRDRGCGISPENLKKIFEPFFTTKASGSGIGLATCYRVVKQHEGDITVRSKEHVGTEFKVFIPASRNAAKLKNPCVKSNRDELIRGSGNILVVDDQKSVRHVASMILRKLGYTVETAADGEEAVKIYDAWKKENRPFLAVLMDMTLPGGMNGEETFREIRRIDMQTRVIASSGFFEDDAYETFRNLGFANILPKPYPASVLSKVIYETICTPVV